MDKRLYARGLAALLLGLTIQACSGDAAAPPTNDKAPAPVFTSSEDPVYKTATPAWDRTTTYDWTLEKTVAPASLTLATGEFGTFNYTVTVTRGAPTIVDVYSVSGQICVKNIAPSGQAQLTVLNDLFYSSAGLLKTTAVDYSSNPILDAGETGCYPYEFELDAGFAPSAELTYWNIGHIEAVAVGGTQTGSANTPTVPVVWPAEPTSSSVIDESATLHDDTFSCPAGFTCSFSAGSWNFNASGQVNFGVLVTNVDAVCGGDFNVNNWARLFEDDTQTRHDDDAPSKVYTPECFSGCTPGFWQGGFGSNLWNVPSDPDWVGSNPQPFYHGTLFNSFFTAHANLNGQTVLQVIMNGAGSDPVNKAARSLVAAYLNAADGGYPYSMSQLATMWTDALTGTARQVRTQLLALHTDLDLKNNSYDCRE